MKNFLLAILSLILGFIFGCSQSGSQIVQPVNNDPVTFQVGTTSTIQTASIGPSGGELNGSGQLAGVKIVFPAGALKNTNTVTLGCNNGTLTPISGTFPGKVISLVTSTDKIFDQPVRITAPLPSADVNPIPYYIDEDGHLNLCQLIGIDRVNLTFTFETFHASFYTWFLDTFHIQSASSSYRPVNDGFQINNSGSTYNRGGECFGMTSWSLWWFKNKKASNGNFYPKYMSNIDTDSDGNKIKGQHIIATRAFISIAQQWNTYLPAVVFQKNLTDKDQFITIQNALSNTKNPVLIYLYNTGGGATHSVLTYDVDSTGMNIYDPNHPGGVNRIAYNSSSNKWSPYGGFSGMVFNGDGSLHLTEGYRYIFEDAEVDFHNSGSVKVSIVSHTSNQDVTDRIITLKGSLQNGQVAATKLVVTVGSTQYSTNVDFNGIFSIPITLTSGKNYIRFTTYGHNSSGTEIEIPNDYSTKDFVLNLTLPKSKILVTLTWNTNGTDVDLYVIDPTGDYSCYFHKQTHSGGILDYDITTGYGPEHWTLMNTNTIQYNQPYKVRVHYYNDHGYGATNYIVTIKTNEGTPEEKTITKSGHLGAWDSNNDGCNGLGSDWADIDTITLSGPSTMTTQTVHVPEVPSIEFRKSLKK